MRSNRASSRRPGITLALGLLVLGMIVLVFGALLHRVSQARAVHLGELRSVQAGWLAESGLERAWGRLEEDREYPGETWRISGEELGGIDGARVEIVVEPIDGRPELRRVKVRADYPDDRWTRVRRSKTGIVELKPGSDGG